MRVLIVDDQVISQDAVRDILEMQGHEVLGACADREAALEAADATAPDAVLVDANLGAEHGTDVVRALRQAYPDLPLVLMSMSVARDDVVRACGASAFLTKERLLDEDLEALVRSGRDICRD